MRFPRFCGLGCDKGEDSHEQEQEQILFRDWHVGASRRGTAQGELGDEGDAFAGGDHAGEVIEVQGGGAETRSEPGLPADFLVPDAMRVGVVNLDIEEDLVREVAETHSGTAGERVFGSNQDHQRAAEDFYGFEMPGTGEPGKGRADEADMDLAAGDPIQLLGRHHVGDRDARSGLAARKRARQAGKKLKVAGPIVATRNSPVWPAAASRARFTAVSALANTCRDSRRKTAPASVSATRL